LLDVRRDWLTFIKIINDQSGSEAVTFNWEVVCIGGFFIECKCGVKFELTEIQFDDFDCGMMGFLHCPECNMIIAPYFKTREIKITEQQVYGEDPGWVK
jgi:hypothetical protein